MAMERILGKRLVAGGLLYIALTGMPSSAALDRFGHLGGRWHKKGFSSATTLRCVDVGLFPKEVALKG